MGDNVSAAEDDALQSQLQSLEQQRDQLAALLAGDDKDPMSSLVQLQAELTVAIDGIRESLNRQTPPVGPSKGDGGEGVSTNVALGEVFLAPRIFDRRRARAIIEEVDSAKGTCLVTWVHPRQRGELPCRYWKEGTCKFSGPDCPFSHGVEVSLRDLLPDNTKSTSSTSAGELGRDSAAEWLESLRKGSRLLARYEDRVWYGATADGPATVTAGGPSIAVLFDGFEDEGAVPILADSSNLAPLEEVAEPSQATEGELRNSGRGDVGDSDDDSSGLEDAWADAPNLLPEEKFFHERVLGDEPMNVDKSGGGHGGSGERGEGARDEVYVVGDWEQHTKGFGSRMMSKMGYRRGEGLGKEKQGIARPVEIRVLPERCALDHLRGDGRNCNRPVSALRKKKKSKKPGASSEQNSDDPQKAMFDFLNVTIHAAAKGEGGRGSSTARQSGRSSSFVNRRPVFDTQHLPKSGPSSASHASSSAQRSTHGTESYAKATSLRAADMTKSQLRAHLVGAREAETKLATKIVRLEDTVARNKDRDPRTAAQARSKLEEVRAQAREIKASRDKAERVLGDRADRGKGGSKGRLFSF